MAKFVVEVVVDDCDPESKFHTGQIVESSVVHSLVWAERRNNEYIRKWMDIPWEVHNAQFRVRWKRVKEI